MRLRLVATTKFASRRSEAVEHLNTYVLQMIKLNALRPVDKMWDRPIWPMMAELQPKVQEDRKQLSAFHGADVALQYLGPILSHMGLNRQEFMHSTTRFLCKALEV